MSAAINTTPVLVMGAGNVGCWLGGRLQAAGATVHYVGHARMLEALSAHGLTLTDLDGGRLHLPADQLHLHAKVPAGLAPAVVLLCVKSGATTEAAAELAARLPAGTLVLSMQNGVSNAPLAQTVARRLTVLPGMVPFNVAEIGPGQLHRGTEGQLAVQADAALQPLQPLFERAGLPLQLQDDLSAVQWGKLLMNLNNSVNALSGLPLRAQLLDRNLRCCTAALIDETLSVLKLAGIQPAALSPLKPSRIPLVLRLPTPLFRLVARRMLRIDDQARSSMADDLARGRPTEIDAIQGEVLRLAASVGTTARLNARVAELVRAWPQRRRFLSGRTLRRALDL